MRERERLPELVERLQNLFRQREHSAAAVHGLNSAQMGALLYLFRANQYSNTPAAVCEYLGLTKGTVSQTLLRLESGGWLRRKADATDGRMVRLELTARSRRLVEDYRDDLAKAVPGREAEALEAALHSLLAAMQRANGGRSFGVCQTCRHFLREAGDQHRCGLTGELLALTQIKLICREHEKPEAA